MITWALGTLALPFVLLSAFDLARRPTIGRLALRNVARRPGEAVLVIGGSLLGTAIICASFVVGDTFRATIADGARTRLGPVDVVVRVASLERFSGVVANLHRPHSFADGTLPAVSAPAAVRSTGPSPRAEPSATIIEVDFDAARAFGADPAATGLAGAGPTPSGNQAVIASDLADRLGVGAGDGIELFAYDTRLPLVVRDVVPVLGIAGFGRPSVFVAPGTLEAISQVAVLSGAPPPAGLLMISNPGGVFDGAAASTATADAVAQIIGSPPGVEVQTRKADLLEAADNEASSFTELFGGIGAFSVIAGVLLLVNIFVMLADERQSELGMLRAVGMRRNQLVRAFGAEGAIYAVAAALAGSLVGLGVGRVVVIAAENVFNAGTDERFRLALRFTAEGGSLVSAMVIGGTISLLTVWVTSTRIGRLNVIRAIRNLPEPSHHRGGGRRLAAAALGVAAGVALLALGVSSRAWFPALVGPPLAAASAVPLVSRVVPRRLAVSAACAATLVWGTVAVTVLPDIFEGSSIVVFVVQGLILVAAAVGLGATNADLVGRALGRLGGSRRSLSARLAFAYPMSRRFRTSMLLGMYALVVFVFTFLAVFSALFSAQGPRFTEETSAGYDLIVDSTPTTPASINLLVAQPGVVAVAPIVRGFPDFSAPHRREPTPWAMSGFDRSFLDRGLPALASRSPEFATDRAVWEAVLDSHDLMVVSDFFLQQGGGPPAARIHLDDEVSAANSLTGEVRTYRVAAILSSDFVDHGALVGGPAALEFLAGDAVTNRHLIAVRDGLDPETVAAELTAGLVTFGADARSIAEIVSASLAGQAGFIRLMQGYLTLGLVVGIAGLGVVMVRAVRERRRQIGMLRAMGFPRRVVRASFLLEAGFVAVEGVLFGVGLALVVSYQLLSNSSVFGEADLPFTVPWASLALVFGVAVVASLAAAAAPASQAARIRPAVALRIAD